MCSELYTTNFWYVIFRNAPQTHGFNVSALKSIEPSAVLHRSWGLIHGSSDQSKSLSLLSIWIAGVLPEIRCSTVSSNLFAWHLWSRSCCSREQVWNRDLISWQFPFYQGSSLGVTFRLLTTLGFPPTRAGVQTLRSFPHPRFSPSSLFVKAHRFLVHWTHCSFLALLYNEIGNLSTLFV